MLQIEDIKALNIEVSAKCIGSCPFCSRSQKVRPYGEHVITLSEFKLLPASFLKQLQIITFGGNFGDFCSNPEFVEIARYIKQTNDTVKMGGDTNGASQDEAWWKTLGPFFHDGGLVFTLDGLEDTHSIHRRGTSFGKIIRNVKSFTAAGGVAHWKFVLFEHNEHQIKDAEALAKEIGCSRFFVISSRDYDDRRRQPQTFNIDIKRDLFLSYWEKLEDGEKHAMCKPWNAGSIYIAADGTVHPCCFAHCMYITEHNKLFGYMVSLVDKYYNDINFKTTPLQGILAGPYFEEVFAKSKLNKYCTIKCNKYKKEIRKNLILYDTYF